MGCGRKDASQFKYSTCEIVLGKQELSAEEELEGSLGEYEETECAVCVKILHGVQISPLLYGNETRFLKLKKKIKGFTMINFRR